jgi:hypothetical protein
MKQRLLDMLAARDLDAIAAWAVRSKRVIGALVSLTYHEDPLTAWRAVEAIGAAAGRVADDDADFVREQLRRLHWLLSEESGGICWMAPQAMAEIVRARPSLFPDYANIVATLIVTLALEDLPHFRAGILWAIGRIAPVAAAAVDPVIPEVVAGLDDPDPNIRGVAVWCLGQTRQRGILADRPDLLSDQSVVHLYANGRVTRTTVGALAAESI